MSGFADIPPVVIEFIRAEFAKANDTTSNSTFFHPNLHEEQLDFSLVNSLSASPPTFFAAENAAVQIESHWLGGRRMWRRWEIADIAIFIILRRSGYLDSRKVALLQTKRLYSREIPVVGLSLSDYVIGVGRIADRTDPSFPLSRPRSFTFDENCRYNALRHGPSSEPEEEPQPERIDNDTADSGIPVYYGFYNPPELPVFATYPHNSTALAPAQNIIGNRVQPAPAVHAVLAGLPAGTAPSVADLKASSQFDDNDPQSQLGWRLENFIADEVLRCRQGKLFTDQSDENLRRLLYERSAPLMSAISITVDLGGKD
ncbi:hypothetical protein [Bradyrhizobium sp. USDA 4506]